MFRSLPSLLVLLLSLLMASSCANYKMHLPAELEENPVATPPTNLAVTHSMYLIGDAGDATDERANSAVKLLKKKLKGEGENSSVIILGDNIYPVGLAPKSERKKRKIGESHLDAQLDFLKGYKGTSIFLPGNHDWYKYGVKGLDRQERYLEKRINKGLDDDDDDDWKNAFLPDNGCSGPELVKINDDLVIIVIDSQWWLMNWDRVPNVNDGCEYRARVDFAAAYKGLVRKNKYKNIVIALHHPIHSNGIHGGHYTLKNHIFPLTSFAPNLKIPLPVVGSVFQFLRGFIGSRQDINNSHYKKMIKDLVEPAEEHGEFIFVAGHEHSLQYTKKDGQHFIVSGAGSKKSPTRASVDSPFSHGHEGFSKIDFYEDGSAWLEFWIPTFGESDGKMVFRQQMKGPLEDIDDNTPISFPEYEDPSLTVSKKPILTEVKPVGKFHSWILGDHYRDIYLEKFEFKKLDLSTYKGGVEVLMRGGGLQTNSLRLENDQGQQFVMRSLTKDLTRAIPFPLNKIRFITFLFKDNYLATQPFVPLAIPTFAEACNIYYAKSELYYIPKQPVMGGYNEDFGNQVYITEERASGDWRNLPNFGNSKKIISTNDMFLKTQKNTKHIVDQKWVARSRLFDQLIGDWDRHSDQWRWARTEQDDGTKLYRPIPRDRDQAFSKYDGALIPFLRPWATLLKQMPDYTEEMIDMKWAIYNTRHFDHYFLNELSLEEWKKEAAFLKENLTDEVIEKGFRLMPPKAYELSAPEMSRVLRYRRDNALEIAENMYLQLAKQVGIHGTDDEDFIEVIRQDDEHTLVNLYSLSKKGEKEEKFYSRLFKTSETKEIYIYGLEDDDKFHVKGEVKKGIKVFLVGGWGDDEFFDESKVSGLGKKTKVYDYKDENILDLGSEGADKTSTITRQNTFNYNRLGNMYGANIYLPAPILGYNLNDGFLAGFFLTTHVPGFNKYPYAQTHHISADFSSATLGVRARYSGEFVEVANRWDFVINAEGRTSRSTFNFFGIGNETPRITNDLDFYRVAQSSAYLDFGLQRKLNSDYGRFSIRPLISVTDIKDEADIFISSDESGLTATDFEAKFYAGGVTGIYIENKDDQLNPKKGINFSSELTWQSNLENTSESFVKFGTQLTLYISPGKNNRLTYATKVGTDLINGQFEFFQAPTIGRGNSIRGLRPERYRGDATFYNLNDLRFELINSKKTRLPFSLGLFGSFDHGRVWVEDIPSDKWHISYGGGLWVAPLNLILFSVGYHVSENDQQFVIHASQSF